MRTINYNKNDYRSYFFPNKFKNNTANIIFAH